SEVVVVEPSLARDDASALKPDALDLERRVEGVEKAVLREQVLAVAVAHRAERADRDVRREWDGAAGGGRCDGAVVDDSRRGGSPRHVGVEPSLPPIDLNR